MRLCVNINAWESLSGPLGVMLLIVYKRYLDVIRGLFRGNASRDILAPISYSKIRFRTFQYLTAIFGIIGAFSGREKSLFFYLLESNLKRRKNIRKAATQVEV